MSQLTKKTIVEGNDLIVTCNATSGNPPLTTFFWTKENDRRFQQNGSTIHIPKINRTNSGNYICTAQNTYNTALKGENSQSMPVEVFCKYFQKLMDFVLLKYFSLPFVLSSFFSHLTYLFLYLIG